MKKSTYLMTVAVGELRGEGKILMIPMIPTNLMSPKRKWLKPGSSLGVQFWTIVTIENDDQPAGAVEADFVPAMNNDVYDIAMIPGVGRHGRIS